MTYQTAAPLEHVSMNASNVMAEDIARKVERGSMILDEAYQRGDVWTNAQRIGLVRSWLTGVPIPACIVNNRMSGAWQKANPGDDGSGPAFAVIDGRQRITTAVMWFTGQLAVPASWFKPEHVETVEDTDDGPYVRHAGLTVVGRRKFENGAMLPLCKAQVGTVAEEAEIYLLVNGGGTPQSAADMANAARIAEAAQ